MENQYEEISLKELFEVLWNGKIIIALFTFAFLVVGLLFTILVMDEQYEATSTISVNSIYFEPSDKNFYPTYNAVSAIETLSSTKFANEVITNLELVNSEGELISANSYFNSLNIGLDEDGLIRVTATANTKEKANLLATGIINEFDNFVRNTIQDTGTQIYSNLILALGQEEQHLKQAQNDYVEYITNNENIHVLKSERDQVLNTLKSYNNQLITLIPSIEINFTTLATLSENFDLDQIITSEIAAVITTGVYSGESLSVGVDTPDELIAIKASEMVTTLTIQLSQLSVYQDQVVILTERLLSIEEVVIELEANYESITFDLAIAERDYSAMLLRVEDAFRVLDWDREERIILYSDTLLADAKVGPSKTINGAISIVLGGFSGVVFVFIKKYWME